MTTLQFSTSLKKENEMRYMGSKNRLSKHILPTLEYYRKGLPWVEPFVGGGNMIDKVQGERTGYDFNPDAVAALVLIRDRLEEIPKDISEFTEEDYKSRCLNRPHLKGFASFAYSFAGKHWGGWSRDKQSSDYIKRAYNNAVKQSPLLQGVTLLAKNYLDITLDTRSFIYCDPPYAGTTKYKGGFDHKGFWRWCQRKANEGHIVVVSE